MLVQLLWGIFLASSLAYGLNNKLFPKNFKFGASSAAYQVEGAWNEDGKTPSIWDTFAHAGKIANNETGDIACDSYHKYEEDVECLINLNADHYRFSLSWNRILPSGFANEINELGVKHYQNLIQKLVDNGIEPLVTMYHWDLPQTLADLGGWTNPLMVDYYADYARTVFKLFGDQVKLWLTFNEVKTSCQFSYSEVFPPAYDSPGIGEYLCVHTMLKAHAKAFHIYEKEFKRKQKGKVSLSIESEWYEPASNKSADLKAAERYLQFTFGWLAHPLVHGNYPPVMIKRIANRSAKEGFPRSRLPEFTPKEIAYIKGTYDFLSLNTYSTQLVEANEQPIGEWNWDNDIGAKIWQDSSWQNTSAEWIKVMPSGIRKLLTWIKNEYYNPEIVITENGCATPDGLEDELRIMYHTQYLDAILEAITVDRVYCTRYTVWSLLDNLEWATGYEQKFGIYKVDFDDPNRTRTPKASADFFKRVFETHCLNETCI